MGVENVEELRKLITSVIENPDETCVDTFDTKYFLKKINEPYFNTIIAGDSVKTACALKKTYREAGPQCPVQA